MSDQPNPPPPALRLKPRMRPADVEVPADAAPAVGDVLPAPAITPAIIPVTPPPAVDSAEAPVPPTAAGEGQRFKFRPKLPPAPEERVDPGPAAPIPMAPPLFILDSASPARPAPAEAAPAGDVLLESLRGPKQGVYVSGKMVKKTLPPFPSIAVDGKQKVAHAPLPHLTTSDEGVELDPAMALPPEISRAPSRLLLILLIFLVVGGAGFFGWLYLWARGVAKPVPAVAATPVKAPSGEKGPTLMPSETLTQWAQVPVNAINKAQEAIVARRSAEQARVDALATGEEAPSRPAPQITAAKPPPTMTNVAPGLAAAARIDAGDDSSRAFRLFVANARITGVFQGSPARVMINGKLTRAGDRVDPDLGIVFDGLSPDRRQLIFSDRSGAKVFRGY